MSEQTKLPTGGRISGTTKTVLSAFGAVALFACAGWTWLVAALGFPILLVLATLILLAAIVVFGALGTVGYLGMRAREAAEDPTLEPDEYGPEVCVTHPDGGPVDGRVWDPDVAEILDRQGNRDRRARRDRV